MSDWVLLVSFLLIIGLLAWIVYAQRQINKKSHQLFNTIVESITIQQGINDKQSDVNDLISKNQEILGVHTRLIPPTVGMEAEAFLRWHNGKKDEKDG
jgi:predicted negative regulator of RcsB-dependent stress response